MVGSAMVAVQRRPGRHGGSVERTWLISWLMDQPGRRADLSFGRIVAVICAGPFGADGKPRPVVPPAGRGAVDTAPALTVRQIAINLKA
jgi:hypothetical protein